MLCPPSPFYQVALRTVGCSLGWKCTSWITSRSEICMRQQPVLNRSAKYPTNLVVRALMHKIFADFSLQILILTAASCCCAAIEAPSGFLFEWWSVFWDIYISRTNPSFSECASTYSEVRILHLCQACCMLKKYNSMLHLAFRSRKLRYPSANSSFSSRCSSSNIRCCSNNWYDIACIAPVQRNL